MKHVSKYLITMLLVLFLLLVINLGILMGVFLITQGNVGDLSMQKVSEHVVCENGSYLLQDETRNHLSRKDAFLFLIDENGDVIWSYEMPDELPTHYTLVDITKMTRWYLQDYPVTTWVREDGILVMGYPKNTEWKYGFEIGNDTMKCLIKAFPYLFLCNLFLLIFLPFLLIKKGEKKKEKHRAEWIAGVSHDIRTPLSILLGHAEAGSVIEKQCFKIRDLVGNLNTENKLEAGTGKWNPTEIHLAALIRNLVVDYINLGDERYEFDLQLDEKIENRILMADETLLRRMLENLMNNAMSHNENGCQISITARQESSKKVRLIIADNGIGTSEDHLKQLNGRLEHDYLPEHGLGLRVVKQIAKKYHYTLIFSAKEGQFFACDIIMKCKKISGKKENRR